VGVGICVLPGLPPCLWKLGLRERGVNSSGGKCRVVGRDGEPTKVRNENEGRDFV
jgi:hypothetical protein